MPLTGLRCDSLRESADFISCRLLYYAKGYYIMLRAIQNACAISETGFMKI